MIAVNTTKGHSNQRIDLTTVRWEVFRGTMDYLLRGLVVYIVRIIHLGVAVSATPSRLLGISMAGAELWFPGFECPRNYEHRLAKKKGARVN